MPQKKNHQTTTTNFHPRLMPPGNRESAFFVRNGFRVLQYTWEGNKAAYLVIAFFALFRLLWRFRSVNRYNMALKKETVSWSCFDGIVFPAQNPKQK